jgi:general secretion pathway protein G
MHTAAARTTARRGEVRPRPRRGAGFTLIEMVIVAALLTILAAVTLPVVKFAEKRQKEMELHAALREMRYAIDEFKRYSDNGFIPIEFGTDGYPKDLEVLVEGVEIVGQIDQQVRFLRRIPVDPMTGDTEWGLRSYQDDFDSESWGGENVYDVYSLSEGVGLNDVPYREW